ncbi:MAG: DsrE family protein [Ginsengibacter sp.]
MKKSFLFICVCFLLSQISFCQANENLDLNKKIADSIMTARKDSLKWAKLESLAYFPLIKAGTFSGVLPVEGVDEIPSPKRQYKLLFEFTLNFKDTSHEKLNPGLVEIARVLNLHVASGIPISHIHPVIIVHGPSLFSIRNNDVFQAKFKKDNPNSKLIEDLMKNGARFIACGQAMNFLDVKKSDLYPGVKVSLTAQTALSNYVGQGYVWYQISEER